MDCFKNKTILLVEDEKATGIMQKLQLEELDYRVILADSGEKALAVIDDRAEVIDLILMDIELGDGMDGTQAASEILKKIDIPLVFLSSHTEPEIVQKTEEVTSYGYVVKNTGKTVLDASIKMAFKLFDARKRELEKEKSLAESEEKYRKLLDNSLAAIGIARGDRHVYGNKALLELFGCSTIERFIDTPMLDFVAPESRKLITERLQKRIKGESLPAQYEFKILRGDGSTRDVKIYTSEITINGQKYIQSVFNDITRQKSLEKNFRISEARLESLLRINNCSSGSVKELLDFALEEAIALTGSEIGYIYFYDEGKREFILNTWSSKAMRSCSVVDPKTVYGLEKTGIWGEAVRQRRPIMVNDFAAPNPMKKGLPEGHTPLKNFLTIPVFSDGRIVAVTGVANKETDYDESDIRQLELMMQAVWRVVVRRQVEEELRISEEKFHLAFKTSPYILIMTLPAENGRIIEVNDAFTEIMGYSRNETIGSNTLELNLWVSEDDRTRLLIELATGNKISGRELRFRKKNGDIMTGLFSAEMISLKNCMALISSIKDITEQK